MRPLVMDWREDVEAQNTGDEYLFGPGDIGEPGDDAGGDFADGLFAEGDVVRLLDGRQGGGRQADHRRMRR